MKRCVVSCCLFAAAILCPNTIHAGAASLHDVGSDRQLFIDETFFDNARNVELQLHPPKKSGKKVLQYDKPWESASLNWFNVMKDPGVIDKQAKYRMWYECYDVPGWPTGDDTSFCYAESRDGVHWTKPELGLFEYQKSKENNILFRQIGPSNGHSRVHGTGIFIDPTAPPEARYKAVSQGVWSSEKPPHHITGMFSADGLKWTRYSKPIGDVFADSQYSGFWDQGLRKYVIYGRVFGRVGGNIGRAESADFAQFGPLQAVLQADGRDPPNSNLYNSAVMKYPGAANVYMAFPSLYRRDPKIDTLDIRMATSRDGVHWSYPDQSKPFIPLGAAGTWDSGSLYIGQGLIAAGDQMRLYYSGSPLKHNSTEEQLFHNSMPRAMSFVTLKRDRFVSVEGGKNGGWFVTPPLRFTGSVLKLNADVRTGGSVRVALLDDKGKPLPGYNLNDCVPITGDHLDAIVQWKKGTDVGSRANQPTRMRIELRNASLYGFQFTDAEPSAKTATGKFRLWQLPPASERTVMMSYVIQTAAGEVVVIDGGWEADATYLQGFLRKLGGRVHTWFITHQHDDHLGALTAVLRRPDGVQVDRIYASLLSEDWIKQHEPDQLAAAHEFGAAVGASGTPIMPARLGEKLKIGGLTFEILTVGNEMAKDAANHINNQCMVLRLATPKVSVLFLADLGESGGERILSSPLGQRLRSDYVQMAHHGQRGVSRQVYEAIHARYAMWPTPEWLYELPNANQCVAHDTLTVRKWMQELGVEKNYIMKDGLIELDLPM